MFVDLGAGNVFRFLGIVLVVGKFLFGGFEIHAKTMDLAFLLALIGNEICIVLQDLRFELETLFTECFFRQKTD